MEKLTETERDQALAALSGWKIDGKFIVKRYRFKAFLKGIDFVNDIARLSEEKNHHPFISIDYKLITLKLTSWHAGGLTALDFQLATTYDSIYEKY